VERDRERERGRREGYFGKLVTRRETTTR